MAHELANEDLDSDERRAAAYVLGTLRGAERSRLEASLATNGRLARHVAAWEERMVLLHDGTEPVEPRPETWHKIARRLGREQKAEMKVPSRVRRSRLAWARSLWRSLALWRGLALACLLLTLLLVIRAFEPPTVLVAVLGAADDPAFAMRITVPERVGSVEPVGAPPPPPGSAYELWAVGDEGPPLSLGLLSSATPTPLLPEQLPDWNVKEGTAVRVSLEPREGSSAGRPTGKVVYEGRLVEVR